MAAFVGTWEDTGDRENFEEFAKAMGEHAGKYWLMLNVASAVFQPLYGAELIIFFSIISLWSMQIYMYVHGLLQICSPLVLRSWNKGTV